MLVLDRASTIGFETSSRNSEVIPGRLYHPAGSLKARCCVARRERLYLYCREHGIPDAQIGKLLVATQEDEIAGIERIANMARVNGVNDLQCLTAMQAQRLEPAVGCVAALLLPSTGIIDSQCIDAGFQGEVEAAGAMVVLRTRCCPARFVTTASTSTSVGAEAMAIRRHRVNAAGLFAPGLARTIDGVLRETLPPAYFCRGSIFGGRSDTVSHLVYPVPPLGGLGVHVTSTSQAEGDSARCRTGFRG